MKLYYERACLSCLKTTGEIYSRSKDEKSREILIRHADASRDFIASLAIRRELFDEKEPCEFCGHIGCFDVWNVKMDNYILWEEPSAEHPYIRIEYQRVGDEIHTNLVKICTGTLDIMLTFMDLIPMVMDKLSDETFIKKNNAYLIAHMYLNPKTYKCQMNYLRFAGFSKNEILEGIDMVKANYMRRIMEE